MESKLYENIPAHLGYIRFPEQVLAIQLKKFLAEFSLFSTL